MDNRTYTIPYPVPNTANEEAYVRQIEKRSLRKASTGPGFFILVYFLLMHWIGSLAVYGIIKSQIATFENRIMLQCLVQIISAVGSALLAGLFYKLISRWHISDCLPKSHVPLRTLVPMVMIGLGAAIIANNLAGLFDSNINIFQLKNSAEQSVSTQSIPEMVLYAVAVAIVPAFAEEFAFRGILMGVLRKHGDAFAIMASSVMFGAMHGNTTQIVFAFVLGLIFAFVDCKANSSIPSIIIHFFNNFYSVLLDIIRMNLHWDDATLAVIRLVIMISFCLLGILSYIYFAKTDNRFFRVANSDANPFSKTDVLTFRQKLGVFFTSIGVIVSLCLFLWETVYYLLPEEVKLMIPDWMLL